MAEGGQQSAMEGASVAAPEAAPAPQEGGQSVAPPVDAGAGGEAPGGGVSQMGGAVGVGGGQEEASLGMVTNIYTKYAQDVQQAVEGEASGGTSG